MVEEKQKEQIIAEERMKDLCKECLSSNQIRSYGELCTVYSPRFYINYDSRPVGQYSHSYLCNVFSEVRIKMIAEYGAEKYERVKLYLLCNGVSKTENLAPTYSVNGTNGKYPYAEEMEFFLANYDSISCDTNAGGYRLPTESELSILNREVHGNFTETDFMVRRKK